MSGLTAWPVSLGLAIRGFVRRAEVGRLTKEISLGAYDIAMMAMWRQWDLDEPGRPRPDGDVRFREALARLAAMALEST